MWILNLMNGSIVERRGTCNKLNNTSPAVAATSRLHFPIFINFNSENKFTQLSNAFVNKREEEETKKKIAAWKRDDASKKKFLENEKNSPSQKNIKINKSFSFRPEGLTSCLVNLL